jgi:cell division protein ZapA
MGQISVTLNGRAYLLECGDGEEQHLLSLSKVMGEHIESLKTRFGQIGDDRLMLMAGLMVADELAETKARLAEVSASLENARKDKASSDEQVQSVRDEMAGRINAAAERIEALNALLAGQAGDAGQGAVS